MKYRRTLGIAVATVALGMVSVPQAFAADHSMETKDTMFPGEDAAGRMEFTEHGDIVKVCDTDADGDAAYLTVFDGSRDGPKLYWIRAGGEGNCTTVRASMGGKYNLPEHNIHFLICRGDDQLHAGYCNGATWHNDN
ncbi:hypothetical protein [Kribbella italica]|uniref:Uncharacterized protein n=1 Tax=Kribbella italica TaxID=1540520 RepID=A0A7W9JC79_9ACTN|nr:hypothetical protein [Kribbella italica]MBB5839289.1 hypothetical protein [Kribbella italica]